MMGRKSSCGFVTARGQTKILHSSLAKLGVGAGLVPALGRAPTRGAPTRRVFQPSLASEIRDSIIARPES
jgi:hypothetical protein